MNAILFILPIFLISFSFAYAEPLENIETSVLNYDGNFATISITWNSELAVSYYEIGCVSCVPHIITNTADNTITLSNVAALPNGSSVILYVIAYDSTNEIITAKQIIIQLN